MKNNRVKSKPYVPPRADKEVLISYLREDEFEGQILNYLCSINYSSVLTLVREVLIRDSNKLMVPILDYYLSTRVSNLELAIREYITLYSSYMLVNNRMIDLNKVKYKSILVNASTFVTLEFKLP